MEFEKTKYCVHCGEKVSADAEKCVHCGEWLKENSVSRNHTSYRYTSQRVMDEENKDLGDVPNENVGDNSVNPSNNSNNANMNNKGAVTEYSKILPIRRLLLLMLLTLGVYSLYWIYKTNCYLKDDLGKDVSPGLRTFLMIIPIANIIIFYQTLEDMNQFIKQERIETYSSGLNILIWFFIPFAGFWVYINVQESINEFWRIKESNLPIRREFSSSEIVVMALGAIIWVFYYILIIFASILGSMSGV
ncbi:zinc ribbon domain-containing protein [Methanobrevibacter sp. TMH8]|uniref:zinc ribbon domain-containing protein n=1 Tax=Methanobrevibacter sp. TMH8 TaxID=2848611 RepID=UPI001CCB6ABA|nr:zinc ribbon domain-containing protein [Methanobrevibacter sp. TMH8]MBZ9571311.1 zinc ribbon domain-containing protein [Methanobrevibacter sp. TMH8]